MINKLKKLNIKAIVGLVKQLVLHHPVELLACVAAYMLMFFCNNGDAWDKVALLPLVFSASYVVNNFTRHSRWLRLAYYASAVCVVVMCVVDADVFVASMGYAFALLLSAIFIVLSYRGRSDDDVSDNAVKAIVSAFIAEIAAVMFTLAVLAIQK